MQTYTTISGSTNMAIKNVDGNPTSLVNANALYAQLQNFTAEINTINETLASLAAISVYPDVTNPNK